MSRRPIVFRSVALAAVAVILAGVSVAAALPSQDAEPQERGADVSPQQAIVARMVGTWDIQVNGMAPEPIKGTSVIRLVGKQWAVEEVKSTMMGQPFEGLSIVGYDTERAKFAGVWVDSFETKLSQTWSSWDEATQTLVNEPTEEMGPMGKIKVVGRFKSIDADHWVFTQSPEGDASTVLWSVEYARRP